MQLATLQLENRTFQVLLAPLHGSGRDEFLGLGWQMLQQQIAPPWIQFSKDIVDQEQWRCTLFHHEDPCLRGLQCEGNGTLLALRCVSVCSVCLHQNLNVVAMGTDNCLANTRLLRAGICQIAREIVTIARRELEHQSFTGSADLAMCDGREWSQSFNQACSHRR